MTSNERDTERDGMLSPIGGHSVLYTNTTTVLRAGDGWRIIAGGHPLSNHN